MMDNSSRVEFMLAATPFSRSGFLAAEDKLALAELAGEARAFKAGADVVAEGVDTDRVYLLIDGWACRYKTSRDGARQIIGLALPGDICNLDSFMRPRVNFGVTTLTRATAVGLQRDRVQALAAERPGIAGAFTWCTIQENEILGEWALSLGRHSAYKRVARLICEVAVRLGGEHAAAASFEWPVTQQQIGDMLGLTAVHTNRTLRDLRSEGLIVIDGRQVRIPDMTELRSAGEFDGAYLDAGPASPRGWSSSAFG